MAQSRISLIMDLIGGVCQAPAGINIDGEYLQQTPVFALAWLAPA